MFGNNQLLVNEIYSGQTHFDFTKLGSKSYVGRRLDLVGISPPKKFWIAAPPFRRAYLDQNNPPLLEIFEAKTYRYPPQTKIFLKISGKFWIFGQDL